VFSIFPKLPWHHPIKSAFSLLIFYVMRGNELEMYACHQFRLALSVLNCLSCRPERLVPGQVLGSWSRVVLQPQLCEPTR
jgi:hypothetical protein